MIELDATHPKLHSHAAHGNEIALIKPVTITMRHSFFVVARLVP